MTEMQNLPETAAAEARRRLLARRLAGRTTIPRTPAPAAPTAAAAGAGPDRPTPSQLRLWMHQQVHPDSTAYTICDAVRLTGPLDADTLRAAAADVARRHEALRTTFHTADGVPATRTHRDLAPELTVHPSATGLDPLVGRVLTRPFDLAAGPLLRFDLLVEAPDSHVLVISMHHIIGDGWSMSLLVREITAAYLRRTGRPAPEPAPLRTTWSEIVREQAARHAAGGFTAQLDHWKTHLATAGEPAAARTADTGTDTAGGSVPVTLTPALAQRLQAACRAHRVTPYMALLAAFALVVARRTGTARPVIGTPVAGRLRPETEDVIGYFANTLPLAVDTAAADTAELWQRCRSATLGALAHQEVSLAEITEAVRPHAGPGQPLFQALFALQNYPYEPVELHDLTVTPVALPKREAKLDLSLYLYERDGGFEGYLEHRHARWDSAGAALIAADVIRTVEAMTADPAAPLHTIDPVPPAERDLLLTARTGPDRGRPATTLHGLFQASAARTPDAVALVDHDGTELTYAQTLARVNRLTRLLRARGVTTGDRVALLLERGADLVVSMLATTTAGAAFVPVDPAYPDGRVLAMVQGSDARLVLAGPEQAVRAAATGATTLVLDELAGELAALPPHAPDTGSTPSDLAYMIYTSGSTGTPKGIGVTHRGVVNHNLGCVEVFALTPHDRVLHFSSPSFDASVEEIFPALAAGARVVCRPADAIDTFPRFDRLVTDRGITVLGLPTAYWERWYEHLRDSGSGPAPAVRLVTLSGQRVNPESVRRWQDDARTAEVELVNTYGPTEATVTTSTHAVAGTAGRAPATGDIPIGTPWPGYRPYVLDDRLRLLPDGAVGELCIGGTGVSLGYLGAPAATALQFVPDPYATEPGERMYRTGDHVRWRPDGTLEFIGRIDGQVKIRGNRVELGEVETSLAAHPSVAQCAVVAYPDGRGDQRLGAHVVLRDTTGDDALVAHLAARLPAYMVPAGFTRHDALPLTANGKVDRRALPAPAAATATVSAPPAGPDEEALARLWQDVLGTGPIGRTDDFFARGGTSLTATVLASRIERDLGRALPLVDIFTHPTLTAMAARIPLAARTAGEAIHPAPAGDDHPASPAQRRIHLIQNASGAGTGYNMPMALRVDGPADPDALRTALQRLVDRHESLRTTFRFDPASGEVRQRIHAALPADFAEHTPDPTAGTTLDDTLTALVQPFDLAEGPLVRARWVHTGPETGVLFLDIHHIAADGTSLQILVEEFMALLDQAELPPVRTQYKDYAHWQISRGADRDAALREHWTRRVDNLPQLTLPLDRPRSEQAGAEGFTTAFGLSPADTAALAAHARAEGATLNMALLAVFGTLLGRWADQDEVVVGSLVAGRHHPDLDRTVGMFANFLPVRVATAPEDDFRRLLTRTRTTVLADYDHQELPFEQIVELAGAAARTGRNPLFDTMLIFHGERGADGPGRHGNLLFTPLEVRHGTAKLDLKLDVFPTPDGGLQIKAEASRALFDEDTVALFGRRFTELCAAAGARPAAPLPELAPATPQETDDLSARRERIHGRPLGLAVVASYTAEPLLGPLSWWCRRFGFDARVGFAGYGQVFQHLLDPASDWNAAANPALLLVRFEDWLADTKTDTAADPSAGSSAGPDTAAAVAHLERTYSELVAAVRGCRATAPRLVAVPPVAPVPADDPVAAAVAELTARWRTDLAALPGITAVDLQAAADRFGLTRWADPAAYALGRVPYTEEFFAVAATEVARRLLAGLLPPFKVIAVDADNTLWRGVAGEDGPLGVEVDEAAAAVQRLLLDKRAEGMLLALVSKNAEADARAVFDTNPGMLLDWHHFAAVRANWTAKSQNLRDIADELSLGLDSFVFLDDSGAECAEVTAALPQVLTLHLPEDRDEHELFLDHVWAFDTAVVTDDDRQRADRYQAERARRENEGSAPSVEAFLAGMELEAFLTPLADGEHDRAAQLTRRTNQFNLSGLRLTTDQLAARREDLATAAHVLRVRDRFGDHGLTGVVLSTLRGTVLELDNVLLSCRVLGRTVEEAVLAGLRTVCEENGATVLAARFLATERNEPARAFLDRYGFSPTDAGATRWELPVEQLPRTPRFVTLHRELPAAPAASVPDTTAAAYPPFDHIGVAVADPQTPADTLAALGYTPGETVHDPAQRSHLRMLTHPARPSVELVAPVDATSPSHAILERFGERPYHLCYRVPSLDETLAAWRAAGISFDPVGEPAPAVLFGGRRVQFLSVAGVGLIELLETAAATTSAAATAAGPEQDTARITLLVADLDKATAFFGRLGYRPGRPLLPEAHDPDGQDAATRTLRRPGSAPLLLAQPHRGTDLAARLDAGGPRPLHLRIAGPDGEDPARPSYLAPLPATGPAGAQAPGTPRPEPRWPEALPAPSADGPAHAHLDPLRLPVARDLLAAVARSSGTATAGHTPYEAPRTPLEAAICAAFGDVLGIPEVGIRDSFFALGGHSLRAVTLLAGLREATGLSVELHEVFDHPTPAALAAAVGARTAAGPHALVHASADPVQPASAAQRRFFVLHELDPLGTHYNLPHAMEITGDLDVARVRAAYRGLLERHEILRTSLHVEDGEPVQAVHPMDVLSADIALTTDDRPADQVLAAFVRPFDLGRAPLMRMSVVRRTAPADRPVHLLVFDIHHIAADGVGLALLVSEFLGLYAGRELPPARQYRDWAAHERTEQYRAVLAEHETYWLSRFAQLPPHLDLPADFPRPPVQSTEGASVRFTVPPATTARLERVARDAGTTLYATLLAALYVTLWRHTGQTDLVVGSPFAGRTVPGTEAMAGPFLNTLPMRAAVEPGEDFTSLLDRVRTAASEALQHQDYPFEELVDRLQVERDPSRNPLFDVMFAFQNMAGGETGPAALDGPDGPGGGTVLRQIDTDTGRSLFDLELFAHPRDGLLECRLDFATRLFREETARALCDRFHGVLDQIGRDPRLPLARIDVLGAAERAELTAGLGARQEEIPAGQTVLSRIEAVAAATPDRTALESGADGRTYGELDAAAGAVAATLTGAAGLDREQLVGILADRGPLLVEAVLGTWKAGGAYIPLDPRHPAARSLGILADAGCRVLLAEPHLLTDELRDGFDGTVLPLTGSAPGIGQEPASAVPAVTAAPAVTQDDLAYVLFTSGSTGRPKGAMVEQRGMLNHMLAKAEDLGLDEDTVLVQNASQCFDISVWQMFGALILGGRTLICDDGTAADPRALLATVADRRATVLEVVPSMLEVMLDQLDRAPAALPALRALVPTGEALPHSLARRWLTRFPDIVMVNAYGPTEASDDITHQLLTTPPGAGSVPIGRPIRNARLYVVDPTVPLDTPGGAALAPRGVQGEICVAGPCVGRGYIGDPERTAAAFHEDPFVGGRLYRTGDIGRWLPDGTLEFLGRKDHQVKIRGHRIELGEVEEALAADTEVAMNAVIVRDDTGSGPRLVAYAVPARPQDDPAAWAAAVRDRLTGRIPSYMVPAVIVPLDRIPVTPNGKIDRKALPAPAASDTRACEVPLSGATEEMVAELFAEVLGAGPVDAAADFFALGGHSLKVVTLLALIQQRADVQLPLAGVFQGPTVREIAALVDRADTTAGTAPGRHVMTRLGRVEREDKLFLFPPIAGWGLVYLPLAELLPEQSVYAFDFVEEEHRIGLYADLVEREAPAGPLRLAGYSAGGNLAFEVARELERRGREVERIVLFDSAPLTGEPSTDAEVGGDGPEEEPLADRIRRHMEEGLRQLDPVLAEALSAPGIQEMAAARRVRYTRYWDALVHTGTVAADLVLVTADPSELGPGEEDRWRSLTTGALTMVRGSGRHAEMMSGLHIQVNAEILKFNKM
ncbi:amino acid adenylation domain-containing protein [Streptomyces sp. NPDC059957]|uniref:amino acid adenylation domain-containing protein n=1 Tax=unclassified Streptomyces TaxID=2593676 RepID=UPI0036630957